MAAEGLECALSATAKQSEPRTPFDWSDQLRTMREEETQVLRRCDIVKRHLKWVKNLPLPTLQLQTAAAAAAQQQPQQRRWKLRLWLRAAAS
jgi:hypothetical protein